MSLKVKNPCSRDKLINVLTLSVISFFKACGSADFLTALAASLAVVLEAVLAGVGFLTGFFADFAVAFTAVGDAFLVLFFVLTVTLASFCTATLAKDFEFELLRVFVLATGVLLPFLVEVVATFAFVLEAFLLLVGAELGLALVRVCLAVLGVGIIWVLLLEFAKFLEREVSFSFVGWNGWLG
jgi:hypothetical protein